MPKSTEQPTATRLKILNAGIDLWRDLDPASLFGGFSVARVSEVAHVTRSTFYSYWPSTDDYVRDLIEYLVDLEATDYPRIVAATSHENTPIASVTDVPASIIEACTFHLKAASEDPTLGLRLGFLAKADDPTIAKPLRDLYRRADEAQYAPFATSLENWGRVLREPFDDRCMQLIFSVLLEGLAARHRLDPDDFPLELYGRALLPILIMATRRPDDERGLSEIADSLNSWPAAGLTSKLQQHEISADPLKNPIAKGSMRAVTIAIRRLLARIGFGELSIPEIAVVTGYSELTLQQMFGSRPGMALCILFINSYERYIDVSPEIHGIERVRQMIAINLDELRRNPAIGRNMMLLLTGHTALPRLDLIDFDPRPMFDDAVLEAVANGEIRPDLDPMQFSQVLQRTLFIEGSQLATASASIDTIELLLAGAGAPPPSPRHDTATVSPQ